MVFQEGVLRKNVGYLGRNLQRLVFVDDEEKNTNWLPSNSFRIKVFNGDKQDKELLHLTDWLSSIFWPIFSLDGVKTNWHSRKTQEALTRPLVNSWNRLNFVNYSTINLILVSWRIKNQQKAKLTYQKIFPYF